MGISRVDYDGDTLVDLSNDSVTPETLALGETAHDANGNPIVGTMSVDDGNDYFIHVKCSPEYQAGDDTNSYYVFDPHMMSIAEWASLRSDGKNIKLKVEIGTIDDAPVELIASRVIPPEGVTGNQMFSADYNGSKYDFGLTTDRTYVIIQCHEPVAYMTSDNLVTELTPEVTDDQYPSALAVHTAIQDAIADVGSGGGSGTAVKEIFNISTFTNAFDEVEVDCSFADLVSAIDAGKLIVLNGKAAHVTSKNSSQVKLAFWKTSGQEEWTIGSDGWISTANSKTYLTSADTAGVVNASSTHQKIPTAKAVYDARQIEYVQCSLDLSTMSITEISHTNLQLRNLINANKQCVLICSTPLGPVYGSLAHMDAQSNDVQFSIMLYANMGQDFNLYYFHMFVHANDTVELTTKLISLIG